MMVHKREIKVGCVYTKRTHDVIPRLVIANDNEIVLYILVYSDRVMIEPSAFPSSCLLRSFKAWAEEEVPMNDFIRQQLSNYHEAKRALVSKMEDMVLIHPLTMGIDSESPSPTEEESRKRGLHATVEHHLPDFCSGVNHIASNDPEAILILHQDTFAAGYDLDEYTLLGMAIKYAGLKGVGVTIHGTNHETF